MKHIYWRNIVPPGAVAHTARSLKTYRNPAPMHGHDFAELFWIESGKGKHLVNGNTLSLTIGDVVFIRPNDCHSIVTGVADELVLVNVAFCIEYYRTIEKRFGTQMHQWFNPGVTIPVTYRVNRRILDDLGEQFNQLARSTRTSFYLERFLLNIFFAIGHSEESEIPTDAPEWFHRACREIRESHNLVRGVRAFFELSNRSPEHVARVTKQLLRITPVDYVNKLRIHYAARELTINCRSITQIAFDMGFENMSHFYTLFRRYIGITPKAYRRRHRTVV